jgi:hypothetical protein
LYHGSGLDLIETGIVQIPPDYVVNWLRVLGTAELPHIDQGVRHQFHAKMSLLNTQK